MSWLTRSTPSFAHRNSPVLNSPNLPRRESSFQESGAFVRAFTIPVAAATMAP